MRKRRIASAFAKSTPVEMTAGRGGGCGVIPSIERVQVLLAAARALVYG